MIPKHNPALVLGLAASAQKILIPMVRKILPGLIAQDIMNVQPMASSSGRILTSMKLKSTPKPKDEFSRPKWYEADRAIDHSSPWPFFKYSREQYSWCIAQFGPSPLHPDAWSRWYMINDRYRFRDEKDYMLFILRWA